MDIEPLCLVPAKRLVIAATSGGPHSRWSKPFRKPKSVRLLEQSSLRRNVENFSYCLRNACLKIGAKDMMAMLDLIDDGASLPRILRFRRVPKIEAILSAVSRHRPSSQLRSNSL